jgi:hypothetical protein
MEDWPDWYRLAPAFVLTYVHSGGAWGDKVREHISHSHDRRITLSRV